MIEGGIIWRIGYQLRVVNTGESPTFVRVAVATIIDVTMSRTINIRKWRVLEEVSLSHHRYISLGKKNKKAYERCKGRSQKTALH